MVFFYLNYKLTSFKTMENIKAIIRKHINKTGASELLMPNLLSEEIHE